MADRLFHRLPLELKGIIIRQMRPDLRQLDVLRGYEPMADAVQLFSKTKFNAELNRQEYTGLASEVIDDFHSENTGRSENGDQPLPIPSADEMIRAHPEFQGAPGDHLRRVAYSEYIMNPPMEAAGRPLHEQAAAYHGLNPDMKQETARLEVDWRLDDWEGEPEIHVFRVPDGSITDPALRHPVLRDIDKFGLREPASVEQMRMQGFRITMNSRTIGDRWQNPTPENVKALANHLGEGHPKLRQMMLMEGAALGIQLLPDPPLFSNLKNDYGAFIARAAIAMAWKAHMADLPPVERPDLKDPESVGQFIARFIERRVPSLPAHESSIGMELRGVAIGHALERGHIGYDEVALHGEASSREAVARTIFDKIDRMIVSCYDEDPVLVNWEDPTKLHKIVGETLDDFRSEVGLAEHRVILGLDDTDFARDLHARGLARLIQFQALTDAQAEASYGKEAADKANWLQFDS